MRLKELFLGREKDPRDPRIFHKITLAALFAWVGLGADGLSSSCYGPEEAYKALQHSGAGDFRFLAPFLALAVAITVFVISASYYQVLQLFPTGGGGYVVATKLLGQGPGLLCGCALVADLALTIAISVASGVDAVFNFLPGLHAYKPHVAIAATVGLLVLNLRGVKESISFMAPVFLLFIATHAGFLLAALFSNPHQIEATFSETFTETGRYLAGGQLALLAVVLLKAYSLGAGTFTGIEAVTASAQVLAEPRVETGRRTILYMALSLALTAGLLLLCYRITHVEPIRGKTLNAVLFGEVGNFRVGTLPIGGVLVVVALLSEAGLLFVAAQAGFIGGPRVIATMALDSWVPRRFAFLSDRLVVQNGVLIMATVAVGMLVFTKAHVGMLVVLYSINVFIVYTLSQLGLSAHWWSRRKTDPTWARRLAVSGLGCTLTAAILAVMVFLKFREGAWATLLVTLGLCGICAWINSHYRRVGRLLEKLDRSLLKIPMPDRAEVPPLDRDQPMAILLVTGYNGKGVHSFFAIPKLFRKIFRQAVFVSVGVVDFGKFKGVSEIKNLERSVEEDLKRYTAMANGYGWYAEYRMGIDAEPLPEIERICEGLAKEFPQAVVFVGQVIFPQETFLARILHNDFAFDLQRRLQFKGIQVVVLPVRALA